MTEALLWAMYALPLAAIVWAYVHRRRRREEGDARQWRQAMESGLTEPRSLHPVVDPALCMGAGGCVRACPEHALGIVGGKALLVNPSACIGHGTCAPACPVEAIKLVFGTERAGIDIPYVNSTLESNVPGIFIAGELAGRGLIHTAAEQGWRAMESIVKRRAKDGELDVVIVGAGPAGLTAGLAAMQNKLKFIMLEQESSLGGTVYHYPRHKIVLTRPVDFPFMPRLRSGEISKEELLAFWQNVVERAGLPVQYGQRVERIVPLDRGGFEVRTALAVAYRAKSVLLALGLSGTPRKLGVPGEQLPKVVYRLVDAEQYRGKRVLVVGGGDAAVEAAVSIAREPQAEVTLCYRGQALGRVKEKNRERLEQLRGDGRLAVTLRSHVTRIADREVMIKRDAEVVALKNDAVIVCAGGTLPAPMLRETGIIVKTKFGSA